MVVLSLFGWTEREEPPFFGFRKTWVFLEKKDMKKIDDKKIRQWVLEVADEYPYISYFKVVQYITPYKTRSRYFNIDEIEEGVLGFG